MRCPFCGWEFEERDSEELCKNCAVFGGCKKVKCPHCGYESPAEPKSVRWIREKFGKKQHDHNC